LKAFVSVSKSIIFWGCGNPMEDTEKCIEKKIQEALKYRTEQYEKTKSKKDKLKMNKLKNLIKHKFPYIWAIEAWINPNKIYKEKLGIPDDTYEELVREAEKRKSDEGFKAI